MSIWIFPPPQADLKANGEARAARVVAKGKSPVPFGVLGRRALYLGNPVLHPQSGIVKENLPVTERGHPKYLSHFICLHFFNVLNELSRTSEDPFLFPTYFPLIPNCSSSLSAHLSSKPSPDS